MDRRGLRRLLEQVRSGRLGVAPALERLHGFPVDDLGFAALDTHRTLRRGFPEVVFGAGKSPRQVTDIVVRLEATGQPVLVTRVDEAMHAAVARVEPRAEFHPEARALTVRPPGRRPRPRPGILVLSAGTSDLQVAAEAALTAEMMGNAVRVIHDVGVAGIHRLTAHREALLGARVIVAVAGMEGALPSVVSGLTGCPVIGVPTSIGYGAGAGGQAALLAMLNSCSAGVTVVNIDNGFGAGYAAALINRPGRPKVK